MAGACPHAEEDVAALARFPTAPRSVTTGEEGVFGGLEQSHESFLGSDKLPRGRQTGATW